jgi:hypothetical protein
MTPRAARTSTDIKTLGGYQWRATQHTARFAKRKQKRSGGYAFGEGAP